MTPTEHRLILRDAGYSPIPVKGKKTYLDEWQKKVEVGADEIARWSVCHSDHPGTGLLTQKVPGFDIDIKSAEAADAVENFVREHFELRGRVLVRVGLAPKRAIPFRTEAPFKKIVANLVAPDGSTGQKIEFLADGQMFVAFGIHPDTRCPYSWHGGEPGKVRREELPEISEAEAKALVEDTARLLCEEHGYSLPVSVTASSKGKSNDWDYILEKIRAGHELHASTSVLAAKLVGIGVSDDGCLSIIRHQMEASVSLKDARWKARYDDIPRQVATARAKFGSPMREEGNEAAPANSEEFLALRFATRQKETLRYVAMWNKWLLFDGTRWKFDETRETFSRARILCREVAAESNKPKDAKAIANAKTRAAVVSLAGEDRRLAATIEQWDADPWLLNTPGGVVDLRANARRDPRADDYMTKISAVAPDPSCATPLWQAFLDKATRGDREYQAFLARVCGYALTGETRDHAMFFLHGDGGNGKGVFMGTLIDILGDYHRTAPIETFTAAKIEQHPTDLAMLRGARLVTATETEEGRRWAESKIKMLTGGDKISARFMRQDFFEYVPQFKLIISGNHKPGLRAVDEAIRRRFHLLPFTVKITAEERDPLLRAKLEPEWPGILAWMIAGCVSWQEIGLNPPRVVTDATASYLQAEDAITLWFDEAYVRDPNGWVPVHQLFTSWQLWAEDNGEYGGSAKRFSQRLEAMGFIPERRMAGGRGFRGLKQAPLSGP